MDKNNGNFVNALETEAGEYCDEFSFRYSARKTTDAVRAGLLVKGAEGKRLTYRQPTGLGAQGSR